MHLSIHSARATHEKRPPSTEIEFLSLPLTQISSGDLPPLVGRHYSVSTLRLGAGRPQQNETPNPGLPFPPPYERHRGE